MIHRDHRRKVLELLGAAGPELDEILTFNEPKPGSVHHIESGPLPLLDEPHLSAWREYALDAARAGAWETLASRFLQFRFPLREGTSRDEAYLRATLEGIPPVGAGAGPPILPSSPDRIEIFIHPSVAGSVPVIRAEDRRDFNALVQIFSCRNEPTPIPDSMGASLVTGLNNWDRIRAYRTEWEGSSAAPRNPGEWSAEFRRFTRDRSLYQDTIVIVGSGPYSDVPAGAAGIDDDSWRGQSARIRLEHECAHYITLRCLGRLGHNLLEEILADFHALIGVYGRYEPDLALRFLGLEAFPCVREDGRIHIYLGKLSQESRPYVHAMAFRVVDNLRLIAESVPDWIGQPTEFAKILLHLTESSLEEVADSGIINRVRTLLDSD